MEPTVFCIIVPLALNICSAPVDFDPLFHLRQKRSITLNTGNGSGIEEGKIVNTAQTDKQLIINIETKVLPQFNVYLDSLQQSPRMQCTTNEEEVDGKTKKRVFTCTSMSNMCCPSTTTCICSETTQPTAISSIGPDPNNCEELCIKCMTTAIVPTYFVPTTSVHDTDNCPELCRQCMTTTIIPTYFVPTTSVHDTDNCPELCRQCMTTSIIPTYFVPTTSVSGPDNCPELCMQCMATTTVPPTNIVRTTCITIPNNCPQLCKQCMATTIVPIAIVASTSASVPFNCPELCRQCYRFMPNPKPTDLLPQSLQCKELCKKCQTKPKVSPLHECLADCQASCHKKYPLPPEQCPELCKQCQRAKTIVQSETKCISCDTLCLMCRRVKFPLRQKRESSFGSDRFQPLIINIEGVDTKDSSYKVNIEGCQTTKCSQPHSSPITCDLVPGSSKCINLCEKCKQASKPIDSLLHDSSKCINLCEKCKHAAKPFDYLVPGSLKCLEFCTKCSNCQFNLTPGSRECESVCLQCKLLVYEPQSKLQPGSQKCIQRCKLCKFIHAKKLKISRKNCTHDFSL